MPTGDSDVLDQIESTSSRDVLSGVNPAVVESADQSLAARTPLHASVPRRFMREGRWPELARLRDQMMRECADKHMPTKDARAWVYSELDRLYPPIEVPGDNHTEPAEDGSTDSLTDGSTRAREGNSASSGTVRDTQCQPATSDSSRVQGLSDVPAAWLPLPANASLAAEIGWVQANRLSVVEERGQLTVVHLDRAHEPAPSRAAIGWLETSIRSYAKFVDVAAKATAGAEDEQQDVRRERMRIEEIKALLDEMHSTG